MAEDSLNLGLRPAWRLAIAVTIGLALTASLLEQGYTAIGISRSASNINHPRYEHITARVQDEGYSTKVRSVLEQDEPLDLCVYCTGIGEFLDVESMQQEVEIVHVNLLGMVQTAALVIPTMVRIFL